MVVRHGDGSLRPHCFPSQDAEKDECWSLAHPSVPHSRTYVYGIASHTLSRVFPFQLGLSGNIITDTPEFCLLGDATSCWVRDKDCHLHFDTKHIALKHNIKPGIPQISCSFHAAYMYWVYRSANVQKLFLKRFYCDWGLSSMVECLPSKHRT